MKKAILLSLLVLFLFSACTQTITTPQGRIGEVIDLKQELPAGVKTPANLTSYQQLIRMENINVSVIVKWNCFEDSTGKYISSVECINVIETTGYIVEASVSGMPVNMGTSAKVLMAKVGTVRARRLSTFRYVERTIPFEILADGKFIEIK